jgi:hypothetical protein
VRLLIEEIVVSTIDSTTPQLALIIHWKGGKHSRLVIRRNRKGPRPNYATPALRGATRDAIQCTEAAPDEPRSCGSAPGNPRISA